MNTRRIAALVSLLGGAPLGSSARAEEIAFRLVPSSDAALASVALLASQAAAPVLLYDARIPGVIERGAAEEGARGECLIRPNTPTAERAALQAAAGRTCVEVHDLTQLARQLWPTPPAVVFAPADDYPWLLRGAALAGALGGALVPVEATRPPSATTLTGWRSAAWYVLGDLAPPLPADAAPIHLSDPEAAAATALTQLGSGVRTVVVANPADRRGRFSATSLSLLAPFIAATHRAPLVLVSSAATAVVETEVQRAIALGRIAPTHVYLVGDEMALRSHHVPDPVLAAGGPESLDGGRDVRVELFSQLQAREPQAYAVGRFVGEDAARGSLTLMRQRRTSAHASGPLVLLSNADAVFTLGETISRTTVAELRNAGLPVRAAYQSAVTPAAIQEALQQADILVWEGHVRDLTLAEEGGVAVERTPPFVVLQGCSTLDRSDPFILLERGTQAIVGTSAAIYSASGSAFARALFDGLVYDRDDIGTAVRDARNYLLALAELKRQRGHRDWTKTYRAALAFALWGDPTAHAPLTTAHPKRPPVSWEVSEAQVLLTVPPRRLRAQRAGRYIAQPVPRAMLGGLVLRAGDQPERTLKELFYTTLAAPSGVTAACPPAPGWEVISLYAPATRTLSVLARPPGDTAAQLVPAGTYPLPLVPTASACR